MRLPCDARDTVVAALRRLGRTEDVRVSPSGRRLALAGYLTNLVLVVDLRLDSGASPRVELLDALEISSPAFDHPHGVAWLDETTIVVASRYGNIGIFTLPEDRPASGRLALEPVRTIGDDRGDLVKHPGSVSVFPIGLGLVELIVCNSLVHHVSRHLIDVRDGCAVIASESLVGTGLRLPDGAAHSPSGRWLAISSHDDHRVLVFRNDDRLGDTSGPDGVLEGVGDPHGLAFTPDERWILSADAGAPFVRLFHSPDGTWEGTRAAASSLQILSEASYDRGHFAPAEGGPKGIDLIADGTLLVATCEEDPLVFFDMRPSLGPMSAAASPVADPAECVREYLLRYLRSARGRVDEATAAIRRTTEREMQFLQASRWWRATTRLRRASEMLQFRLTRTRHRWRVK